MKRRLIIGCALAVLTGLLTYGILIMFECENGKVVRCNYEKVKVGMTVREAETFLGPRPEFLEEGVPVERWPDGRIVPVVSGDSCLKWEDRTTGKDVWVGVKNGKIINKWYWEPSF
jgi:hypothetical protein